jgi:hypothetical protein
VSQAAKPPRTVGHSAANERSTKAPVDARLRCQSIWAGDVSSNYPHLMSDWSFSRSSMLVSYREFHLALVLLQGQWLLHATTAEWWITTWRGGRFPVYTEIY